MRKTIITIVIILFFISIYKDLTIGTPISTNINQKKDNSVTAVNNNSFDIVKIKINPGDTVITVIERLNPELNSFDIELLLKDFSELNPNADPNALMVNRYYFFPKYN